MGYHLPTTIDTALHTTRRGATPSRQQWWAFQMACLRSIGSVYGTVFPCLARSTPHSNTHTHIKTLPLTTLSLHLNYMQAKWVRKNAAFVLGEIAAPTRSVVQVAPPPDRSLPPHPRKRVIFPCPS